MLFGNSPTGSLCLILDIQSSIIRASLVHYPEGTIPHIVHTFSKNIPHRPGSGSGKIIQATLVVLREIMGAMYHFMNQTRHKPGFPKKIDEVHFVLSSPWIISQARTLVKNFKAPTEVTQKLILDTIAGERALLMPEGVGESHGVDIIEEKVFNVRLNGYPVQSWKDKKTTQLEISFSVSFAGTNTAELFRETCTLVAKNKIHFHSSLNLQCVALRQLLPHQSAYTLVHVHGELTDVAVVFHNSCIFFGSYPLGVFGVVRAVAKQTETKIELADSAIHMYTQKSFDASNQNKNMKAVEDAARSWSNEFKKLFAPVLPPISLPAHTVFCGHQHEQFFAKSLRDAYPHLEPQLLTFEDLKPYVSYDVPEEPIRLSGLYAVAIHSLSTGAVL